MTIDHGDRVDDVIAATHRGILRITIDRPERGNALAPPQRNRIIALLEDASVDPDVRTVVITGSGERHFCTGADLRSPTVTVRRAEREYPVGTLSQLISSGVQRLSNAVFDCTKPVIAALNGTAAGVGVQLALSCDLVLAVDDATLIEIFARRGLVADGGGAYLLPRLIGLHKTKELLFFADPLTAPDAERIGLINRAVPRARFAEVVDEWAERLAVGPTVSLGLMKSLVNHSLEQDRSAAFRAEAAAIELNSRSTDAAEGVASFVERRPPAFVGR